MSLLTIDQCINLKAPLLITGESGVGKSHCALEIFNRSTLYREKFITVHLASLKEELIESELFGHRKGAFTGAVENKDGYLKAAGRGTLFLDEIGELSLGAQKKLLYLLEEKKYTPLGSTQSLDFEGRIIMATNKNLEELVKRGEFRLDLFYRINIFNLKLEALRMNQASLLKIIPRILEEITLKYDKNFIRLSTCALEYVRNYSWPGNIRELKNALEYAVALSSKNQIYATDFPSTGRAIVHEDIFGCLPDSYEESFALFEKHFLTQVLSRNNGKVNQVAARLGISKTTLIYKTKKYGINTLKMRALAVDQAA